MSSVRVNTLSDLAGTNSPDVTRGEFLRARFNINGTGTISTRDSFGFTSFVDNGVGDYTGNFTTAMPNVGYSVAATGSDPSVVIGIPVIPPTSASNQALAFIRSRYINGSFADADQSWVQLVIFGDKS